MVAMESSVFFRTREHFAGLLRISVKRGENAPRSFFVPNILRVIYIRSVDSVLWLHLCSKSNVSDCILDTEHLETERS